MLVDDHQLVIDGIKSLLEENKEIEIIGEANDGKQLLSKTKFMEADVILMDVEMKEMGGYETTKELLLKNKNLKVLTLTMHNEVSVIKKMLEAGASGYILKNSDKEEVISAIKKVADGKQHFSSEITFALLNEEEKSDEKKTHSKTDLSEREIEILKLIAEGLTNTEAGEKLFISPRTVDTHRTNIMKKIGVNNVAGLIRYAFQHKLIS